MDVNNRDNLQGMSSSWEWGCDARHLEKYHGLKGGFSGRKGLYPSANRNPEENKSQLISA